MLAWFALHWLGAEVVPANPLYSVGELSFLAEKSQARVVIGLDMRLAAALELTRRCPISHLIVTSLSSHLPFYMRWPYRLKVRLQQTVQASRKTNVNRFDVLYQPNGNPLNQPLLTDPALPAVLQPTGGTTGTPKVAVLTHNNLHANVAQLHVWSGMQAGAETFLSVLPFFHVFGATVALLSPLAGGASLLLQARFNPSRVWTVLNQWQPGVAPMVPFMFKELCEKMQKHGRNITCLRSCMSGAAPLEPDVNEEFRRRTGAAIYEGYGLSEASPVTHVNPPEDARIGSIGLPVPNTQARIVDQETGKQEQPPGEVGELIVRGPQVMAGYLDDPAETSQVLRNGWLHTGDLAKMDDDGFFTIVDRKKDVVISGGLNIYPSEVERVLASHPSIRECAVVGVDDPKYGQRLVAYVVPASKARINSARLQAFCRQELASYKVPRTIVVCDKLPVTHLGKLSRAELRKRAA